MVGERRIGRSQRGDTKTKFLYTGIRVRDLQRSIDFYTKVMGMKLLGRSEIKVAKGEVAALETEPGGAQLELNYYAKGSKFRTKYGAGEELDHLAFQVDDIDRFVERAEKLGHPVIAEIKTEKSRWVYIEDPDGIWVEIVQ